MGRMRFSSVVVGLLVVVMITAVLGCAPKAMAATDQEPAEGEGEPVKGEPIDEITIMLPDDVPLVLVRIPAGTFLMGRYPGEQDSNAHEDPQHSVTIAQDFYMGKYEVTPAAVAAVMGFVAWNGASSEWCGSAIRILRIGKMG
jgi:formylglycine-generating enzyme required for sulfatase activity